MKNLKYILLFLSVTALWGGSFLIVKDLTGSSVPIFFMLSFRFILGALIIFIMKIIKKEPPVSRNEALHGAIMGFIIFLAFAFQTFGLKYTTPANNGMITAVYVIFVPAIASVIKRKLNLKNLLDGFLCFFGMFVLFGGFKGTGNFGFGDALTLCCAFVFAIQFIVLEKYSKNLNTWNYTVVQLVTVAFISIFASFIFEQGAYREMHILQMLPRMVFLGILPTGFAYYVQTFVQTKLKASAVSVIACTEAVFSVVFSLSFGYDVFTFSLIAGSVIIMGSVISAVFRTSSKIKEH